MKIPYLILVGTVLLVSGALSIGSTNSLSMVHEKTSITDSRGGIGPRIDDETTHRQIRLHRMVNHDAANQAENSQTSMEFDDKGRSVQPRRLHASRVQLTIFSLCLLSMKPLGHA